MEIDQGKLEAFMGTMVGHMTGAALCSSIWLGDELGLYRELAGSGPRTPPESPGRKNPLAILVSSANGLMRDIRRPVGIRHGFRHLRAFPGSCHGALR